MLTSLPNYRKHVWDYWGLTNFARIMGKKIQGQIQNGWRRQHAISKIAFVDRVTGFSKSQIVYCSFTILRYQINVNVCGFSNIWLFEVIWVHIWSLEFRCGHLKSCKVIWGHLKSFETIWCNLRSFDTILRRFRPFAVFCGPLRSLKGHFRPTETTWHTLRSLEVIWGRLSSPEYTWDYFRTV